MPDLHAELASALRERLEIIADRALYERDAAAHLEKLKAVSEKIARVRESLPKPVDPRLAHYLQQASYQKALEWLEARVS